VAFGIVDIDHLMIRVADLKIGAETFRKLGFTITPPRQHIDMSALEGATGRESKADRKASINNRHILLTPFPGRDDVANYLELMCIEDQLATPPQVTQMLCFLLDSEGPKTVVTISKDLEHSRQQMLEQGIETSVPVPFRTGWYDEDRDQLVPAHGSPAVPVYGQTPFMTNPCEISTLDGYRYEPWTVHPNGARRLLGVTGITDRIHTHAEAMADNVFGTAVEWASDDVALIWPRDLFFRVVTPAGFAQLYPGLDFSTERILPALCGATVAVDSLDTLCDTLNASGVEYAEIPSGAVVVPRHQAANTIIEFVSGDGVRGPSSR